MKRYFFLVFLLFLLICMVGCIPDSTPSIISVSPSSGIRGQTLDVTIGGTNFLGTESVYFSGSDILVNSFEVISSTEIRANIYIYGGAQLGPKNINVRNAHGIGKGIKLFTVAGAPSITSLIPATGTQGSLMDVSIIGEGFYEIASISFGSGITVEPGYLVISEYVPVNIIVTIDISSTAATGTRNVIITTTHGTATGIAMFTVTALTVTGPVVDSVYPNLSLRGQTIDVSIKGSNFTGTPIVSFGAGIDVNSVTPISSHEIKVNISVDSDAEFGYRDVSVTIGGVTGVGEDLFRVYQFI